MNTFIALLLIVVVVPVIFGGAIYWRFRPGRAGTGRTEDPLYARTYLFPGRWFRRR